MSAVLRVRTAAAALALLFPLAALAAPFGAALVGKHGFTHASVVLQNDINAMMHNAVPILVRRATGREDSIACGRMLRTDTVVTQMTDSQHWSETWTYTVCATQIAIPIDFTPDGKGGAWFTLRTRDVVVGPAPKPI